MAHALPSEAYLDRVMQPLLAIVVAQPLGMAGTFMFSHDRTEAYVGGVLLTVLCWAFAGRYLLDFAARRTPKPVTRARLRRVLAEAAERMRAGAPIAPDEAGKLRTRLRRMSLLGDRLVLRAEGQTWPQAIRAEPRWLLVAVTVALLTPLAVVVLAIAHVAGVRPTAQVWYALADSVAFPAAILAAMLMRRTRCRCDLRDLGRELSTASRSLQDRLSALAIAPPQPPADPTGRRWLRPLWSKLSR